MKGCFKFHDKYIQDCRLCLISAEVGVPQVFVIGAYCILLAAASKNGGKVPDYFLSLLLDRLGGPAFQEDAVRIYDAFRAHGLINRYERIEGWNEDQLSPAENERKEARKAAKAERQRAYRAKKDKEIASRQEVSS